MSEPEQNVKTMLFLTKIRLYNYVLLLKWPIICCLCFGGNLDFLDSSKKVFNTSSSVLFVLIKLLC